MSRVILKDFHSNLFKSCSEVCLFRYVKPMCAAPFIMVVGLMGEAAQKKNGGATKTRLDDSSGRFEKSLVFP